MEMPDIQGRDCAGNVEGSCGYRARGVSIRGQFVLSRNTGYKTMGVAMCLSVVLTSDVKVQVRDLLRVVCIVAPLPFERSVFRENSFYRAQGGKWAEEICAGCPQQPL